MAIELKTSIKDNANAGVPMVLRHPGTGADLEDEEGRKAALLVLGMDADVARKLDRDFEKRNIERARKSRSSTIDPEVFEQHAIDKAVACTVGWQHVSYDGSEEFTPERIRAFYRHEPWALAQFQEFHADRAHFSEPSPTS